MTLRTLYKTAVGAGLALIPAASALAQDAPQAPSWDVSGIARIDTQISDNGTCKQRLPNLIAQMAVSANMMHGRSLPRQLTQVYKITV